jgi:asparagine synthase (glutamine-hydrolysing)
MVSKMTKEAGITVALSGLGGDELFAGYSTFNTYLKFQNNKSFWMLPTFIRKNIGSLLTQIKKDNTSQKLARALSLPNINFEKIYPLFRKAFSNKEIQFLLKKFPSISVLNSLWDEGDIHKINNLPLLSQISVGEIDFYTRDLLLRDTDQMSMAHALEVRVPFFDHELVEYALTIPDSIKKPSYPKELLVDSISPMLPDEIVHRPKMGFTLPWEYWLKNELNSLCETNLKYLIDINLFSNNLLEYWNRFLKGDKTIPWSRIWQLTVLGHWLQKNKVQ